MDSETGIIRTRGTHPFRAKEYEIGVSAQDISAKTPQKSPTNSLKILVGERDPQFYETQYIANVPESANEQYRFAVLFQFQFQIQLIEITLQFWTLNFS